ncbi:hypothetical protein SAMN05428949_4719 [Chitinophaga sp. YR627]|nr:hypothetical protein SAMN05428949_4719 [Chitinophaga sp. YR627]
MTISKENRHVIKRVRSHSKEALHNDKRFQRVRDNWKDFTKAARCAKMMRTIMESIQQPVHDRTRHTMLTRIFSQIIKSDKEVPPGQRNVKREHFEQIEGIELNNGKSFYELMGIVYNPTHFQLMDDMYYAHCVLHYENIKRKELPEDVTNYEITVGFAEIDFTLLTFRLYQKSSGLISVKRKSPPTIKMRVLIGSQRRPYMFLFVAVSFYGKDKHFKTGAVKFAGIFEPVTHVEWLSAIRPYQTPPLKSHLITDTAAPPEMPTH